MNGSSHSHVGKHVCRGHKSCNSAIRSGEDLRWDNFGEEIGRGIERLSAIERAEQSAIRLASDCD